MGRGPPSARGCSASQRIDARYAAPARALRRGDETAWVRDRGVPASWIDIHTYIHTYVHTMQERVRREGRCGRGWTVDWTGLVGRRGIDIHTYIHTYIHTVPKDIGQDKSRQTGRG